MTRGLCSQINLASEPTQTNIHSVLALATAIGVVEKSSAGGEGADGLRRRSGDEHEVGRE
jgi:hypothetical protein